MQDVYAKIREYELKGWVVQETDLSSNKYNFISPEGDIFGSIRLKQLSKRLEEAKGLAQLIEEKDRLLAI